MKYLLMFLMVLHLPSQAATLYARQNGDWDNTATWASSSPTAASCGCIPAPGDIVIIDGFTVLIDAGTGNVTVSSIVLESDVIDANAGLTIAQGMSLTVTGDFFIIANRATRSIILNLNNAGSALSIGGNLVIDQNTGDDIIINLNDNVRLNVSGGYFLYKDGGDDMQTNFNVASPTTSGTLAVTSNYVVLINNYDSQGVVVQMNGVNARLLVGGNVDFRALTASSDVGVTNFNLNAGLVSITGTLLVIRADDCGNINFNLAGGRINAATVQVFSSGTLSAFTGVFFFIDGSSLMSVTNDFSVSMNGGDDFFIHLNMLSGTSASLTIGGNFSINRSSGDDIEIVADDDGSRIQVGGNFSINSSGTGEQTTIELNNDAKFTVGGNFLYTHSNGQNFDLLLQGAGDQPELRVTGNFSVQVNGGSDVLNLSVAGGTLNIGGNCTLNHASGTFSLNLNGSALVDVSGTLSASLTSAANFHIGLGQTSTGSTAKLRVANQASIQCVSSSSSANLSVRVDDTCEIETGALALIHSSSTAPSLSITLNNTGKLDVNGNLTFNATAASKAQIIVTASATLELTGNIVRNASPNMYGIINFSGGGTLELDGTSQQMLSQNTGSGTDYINYHRLRLNNSAAASPQFTLEGPVTVTTGITFLNGVVSTNTINTLTLADNATVTGASNTSHVNGPLLKIGNDAFVFPTGNAGNYQPIAISAPTASTDVFEAQYFQTNPNALYPVNSKTVTLNTVSKSEYWILNRKTGSSSVSVTLSWDANSGGVTSLPDLRVARWNGSTWLDHGNGGSTGSTATGSVVSSSTISAFSPFTLASTTSLNPLPVELIEFTAQTRNKTVDLTWKTAAEYNNCCFMVESTADALHWIATDSLPAKGSNGQPCLYQSTDGNPHMPVTYYRLKQIDNDRQIHYSKIIQVSFPPNAPEITVYPNPSASTHITINSNAILSLSVFDALGKVIPHTYDTLGEETRVTLPNASNGIYLFRIYLRDQQIQRKIEIRQN